MLAHVSSSSCSRKAEPWSAAVYNVILEEAKKTYLGGVCVECLIGKQKKPIFFKVTEPSSIPYRTHSACAKRAANPDPPPVIPLPESIAAQAA